MPEASWDLFPSEASPNLSVQLFFLPDSSWVQESRLDTQWLAVAYEVLIPSSAKTGKNNREENSTRVAQGNGLSLALPGKSCVTFGKMPHFSESVSFFCKMETMHLTSQSSCRKSDQIMDGKVLL